MTFEVFPWRFVFRARDRLYFPAAKSSNILRGAFGTAFRKVSCPPSCASAAACAESSKCAYTRIFEPRQSGFGPSGLAFLPRPFVFRSSDLEDRQISSGEAFHFDLHVFLSRNPEFDVFVTAFEEMARAGLGPGRGRSELEAVWQLDSSHRPAVPLCVEHRGRCDRDPLRLLLSGSDCVVHQVRVQFMTPTEMKSASGIVARPEFDVLFGRARDRVATLRALYGAGTLDIDFKGMGERARGVRVSRSDLRYVDAERRSSRTGQTHPLGGLVGEIEYEGDLGEFLPYLRAAEWTGVGRQTVWGKGEIRVFPGKC